MIHIRCNELRYETIYTNIMNESPINLVVNVKIRMHSDLKAMQSEHAIHLLQKNRTRDVERNNLVPTSNLSSFVQQHARGSVKKLIHQHLHQQLNVKLVKIRIHSNLKVMKPKHVTLLQGKKRYVKRNNLVLVKR